MVFHRAPIIDGDVVTATILLYHIK
jgi:hypothetical protein